MQLKGDYHRAEEECRSSLLMLRRIHGEDAENVNAALSIHQLEILLGKKGNIGAAKSQYRAY